MKKLILMGVSLALIIALAVSGTLAYLTDRDSEANVFTVGDVRIDLQEKFIQGSQLMPGVKLEKEVKIRNIGPNEAWVWYTYAVPAELDEFITVSYADGTPWTVINPAIGTTDLGGTLYNVHLVLCDTSLASGKTTPAGMTHVALDKRVDYSHSENRYYLSDQGKVLEYIDFDIAKTVIYVNAYAIQKDSFRDVNEAYQAFLNQWGTGTSAMTDPKQFATVVRTEAELKAALDADTARIALGADITLTSRITVDCSTDINLNGYTLGVVSVEVQKDASISGGTIESTAANHGTAPLLISGCHLTMKDVTIEADDPVNAQAGYYHYAGIMMDGGTGDFENVRVTVKNTVPYQSIYIHGIEMTHSSLSMNGGSITVTDSAGTSGGSQGNFIAAVSCSSDSTLTLTDTAVNAGLLADCLGGTLTVNTTDGTTNAGNFNVSPGAMYQLNLIN